MHLHILCYVPFYAFAMYKNNFFEDVTGGLTYDHVRFDVRKVYHNICENLSCFMSINKLNIVFC